MLASLPTCTLERKVSRHPEEYSSGAVEAVAGPDSASDAGTAGALEPLLCIDLPASADSAVLIIAFMVHGVARRKAQTRRQRRGQERAGPTAIGSDLRTWAGCSSARTS